ncbi:AraC family transcriptional regulator (plasmid) [Legionella adelaidensis]|uniref:AraC family transcriptional regulator n=1 Tax=Legionella adelaidensis TaxID=45056 RepID=A0A0W0R5B2_9GAMM|nr:rhomboid family intramembrane serine protease [Legionella adelaidensis]KTC66235.1 AraC family transcriptional regulator [Legionella adelaidensis]VEH85750.1 AraC family transcriptional regulator [Legionella adelaidensis]
MLEQLNSSIDYIIKQSTYNFHFILNILALIWGIYFITIFNKNLLYFGIQPRRVVGLPGILFAPLLHANFNHIFFNSIPLVVLSNFLLLQGGVSFFLIITVMITLMSGCLIWCFAKPGLHIGASAVITGYWGFLVFNIYQQGTLTAIILGIICLYYFAGIFFGIFPREKGISWEGHLFGLIAGVTASYFESYFMKFSKLI